MNAPEALKASRPMGVIAGMPFEDYHAVDALSATSLRLFARSPWHYKNRIDKVPTKAMLCGSLAHCAALEPDAMGARYVIAPLDAPRRPTPAQWAAKESNESSRVAKEWWAAFNEKASGKQIIDGADYSITEQQLIALQRDPVIALPLARGRTEVSVFWVDRETGLYCKARPDCVDDTGGSSDDLLDLKATRDESPSGFGRTAAAMGYQLQQAHYVSGWRQAARRHVRQFIFAAVTSAPPVLAVPYVLTDEVRDQAEGEYRQLLDRFAWCQKEDRWPTYGDGIQMLDFPAWAKDSGDVDVAWTEEGATA